jgi:hypothetical protein
MGSEVGRKKRQSAIMSVAWDKNEILRGKKDYLTL